MIGEKQIRDQLIDVSFSGLAACRGDVAYDAFLGGLLQRHPQQWSFENPDRLRSIVNAYQRSAVALFEARGVDARLGLREALLELHPDSVRDMLSANPWYEGVPLELLQIVAAHADPGLAHASREEIHRFARRWRRAPAAAAEGPPPQGKHGERAVPRRGRLDRLPLPKVVRRGVREVLRGLGKRYPSLD